VEPVFATEAHVTVFVPAMVMVSGISASTIARNVGVAALPVAGPEKILLAVWVSRAMFKVPVPVIGPPLAVKMEVSVVDKLTDVTEPEPEPVQPVQVPVTVISVNVWVAVHVLTRLRSSNT
jgi:hypothetical protein